MTELSWIGAGIDTPTAGFRHGICPCVEVQLASIPELRLMWENYTQNQPLVLPDDELRSIEVPTLLLIGEQERAYEAAATGEGEKVDAEP